MATTIVTDTAAKDYDSIIQSLIDFATSQYGESTSANRVWTDFNISSFSRNWAELVAYVGDQLMFYLDTQANQAHLSTATIPSYILNIAQQMGYEVPTQQSASGKSSFTTTGPYTIPAGYTVRAGDIPYFTTREVFGSRAESVEVDVIQGESITESYTAAGLQNEQFILVEPDVVVDLSNPNADLRSPQVRVNGVDYTVVTTPIQAASNSTIVTRSVDADGRMLLTFGDGVLGTRLNPNASIQVVYRIGGGSQGNVEAGEISSLSSPLENVDSVTNSSRTSGGVDFLSISELKARIPLSLETKAGAVDLDGYADILIANFPQVLTAKAAINTTENGIDIDVFVVPQADTVTDITDNQLLFDQLTDFLERKKTVTTRFLIRNGNEVLMDLEVEAYLNRDASRASVEADIRDNIAALFDLRTGNIDGSGMSFAQQVKVGDLFDVLKAIQGIDRFEVKRHTLVPYVVQVVNSPSQQYYVSRVSVYDNAQANEWAVVTDVPSNPEPANGQISAKVFKRTLASVTSVTEDSITDSNIDLTVKEGTALVISNTTVTDPSNVFNLGEYDNFLLVDRDNNIWQIDETRSSSLVVSSPALNDASVTAVVNGEYRIVKSFAGQKVAVSGSSFTVLYNNRNTFFSPAASFDLIATIRSPFFLSEEQTNSATYGVPVAITSVTAQGPNPGDLVEVAFNGNPNLQAVDTSYVLVDREGEVFEIASVQDNDVPVALYDNVNDLTDSITLTDSGTEQSVSMPFLATKEVADSFIEVQVYLKKVDAPSGNILIDIAEDSSGLPGTILATSIPLPTSAILIDNFNTYSFTFSTPVSLTNGGTYHLVVRGDNAYRVSYGASDGSIEIGVDDVSIGYRPAVTATSILFLTGEDIGVLSKATATVTLLNNSIRSRLQGICTLKLFNNFTNPGTYSFTVAGQTFSAVTGSPAPAGEFQIGASLSDTRTNLINAWNAQASSIATATAIGADSILFTANSATYPGESANGLDTSVTQSTPNTWSITAFGGGIDGDSLTLEAPTFLNAGLVAYTYTSGTGIIQFLSAVSLPVSFGSGDYFIDGAGNKFPVLGVDDTNNRVTIDVDLTVDTSVTSLPSGSIYGFYKFEFGDGSLSVGANVDASATNLSNRINSVLGAFVTASALSSVVTIEADLAGSFANGYGLSVVDLGVVTFQLSGDTFSGGREADIIAIDGVELTSVSGTPGIEEFEQGITPVDTLLSIRTAILTSPSLTGVVNATLSGVTLVITAITPGSAGNSITLEIISSPNDAIRFASDTLSGGVDNLRVKTYNGSIWADFSPDSDMLFSVSLSEDSLLVVAKTDDQGSQVLPQLSSGSEVDSSLGKRYYSDGGEVSFLISSVTPNTFVVGASDVNLYGLGTVEGNVNVRVDQFIFRTSKVEDDITNLRENEIPVLDQADLKINLLGGVS